MSLLIWGPGATPEEGGLWGRVMIAHPPEGLRAEVSRQGGQPALGDGAAIRSLDPEAQVRPPGWQHHGEW